MKTHPAPRIRSSRHDLPTATADHRGGRAMVIGSLLGDVDALAKALWRMLPYRPIKVWTNADADVLYHAVSGAPDVDATWVAGTYDLNATPSDIASDLQSLRQERRATGMIDD